MGEKKQHFRYIMHYYFKKGKNALLNNETGSFVETGMDLETVIQTEVRKRKTNTLY